MAAETMPSRSRPLLKCEFILKDKALSRHIEVLTNDAMSPMFLAVIEATEEAIYNSMSRATTMTGHGHTVEALPIEKTTQLLKKYGVIK